MHFPRKLDVLLITVLIGCFVGIRSFYFADSLNFSTDQASFASHALELWRNKEITFAGPTASFNYQGRYLLQSSLIYYTTLFFLLPAHFDPVLGSYLFMLAAAVMCWPLYFAIKHLANRSAAVVVTGLYVFLPIFVEYTKFLFNPNYQLALLPLLVYFCALFHKKEKPIWAFLTGLMGGFLLLFHYQLVIWLLGLALVVVSHKNLKLFGWWVCGGLLGFLPMILFELRSNFYLSRTVWLLVQHGSEVSMSSQGGAFPMHYLLSALLGAIICVTIWTSRHWSSLFSLRSACGFVAILAMGSLGIFGQPPAQGFGMAKNWKFADELRAHQLISDQHLDNFGVVNTLYETRATVQYFLLQRDSLTGATDDYYHNRYLFVIAPKQHTEFSKDSAYELNSFVPAREVQTWQLTPEYNLFLLKREGE